MKVGDKVTSYLGTECTVVKIFQDGSLTMARATPIGGEVKNSHGQIVVMFTDSVETFEARNNPELVVEKNDNG